MMGGDRTEAIDCICVHVLDSERQSMLCVCVCMRVSLQCVRGEQ